jgi:hypothetical protein
MDANTQGKKKVKFLTLSGLEVVFIMKTSVYKVLQKVSKLNILNTFPFNNIPWSGIGLYAFKQTKFCTYPMRDAVM